MPTRPGSPSPPGDRTAFPSVPVCPSVWVVGATGYSGLEAVRLLRGHPGFRLAGLFGSPGTAVRDLADVDPAFARGECRAVPFPPDAFDASGPPLPDAALLALPDEISATLAPRLVERGVRVVDLSAAFRPGSEGSPRGAVYGLSEWSSQDVALARFVANPGCFATAALLALLPPVRDGLVDESAALVVDGKSGITGAGRRLDADLLFAEANENCRPYSPLAHRHVPEMRAALGLPGERAFLFAPHVLPISRGLLTTCYLRLAAGVGSGDVAAAYARAYDGAAAIRLLEPGRLPQIRGVALTGRCDIGWTVDPPRRSAIVVAALDNLLKGAASQALQNLNLIFARPREEGIPL